MTNNKNIWFFLIILIGIILHVFAIRNNNIFFTVDQGRDAVYAREILNGHFFTKGPETSVRGIFTGPLWYYLSAFGYLLTGGHPYGPIVVLLIINSLTLYGIMYWAAKRINFPTALASGILLTSSWSFFELSLWGFNPFPIAAIALFQIICLIEFLRGDKYFYYFSVVLVLLGFNFEVAASVVLFIFSTLVGAYGLKKKVIKTKEYLISTLAIPGIALLVLFKQIVSVFVKTKLLSFDTNGLGVFTGLNFSGTVKSFIEIIGGIIPQNLVLGFITFFVLTFLFLKNKKNIKSNDTSPIRIIELTFVLLVISFLFFASNKGHRAWHTVYLSPLVFISLTVMLFSFKRKIGYFLFGVFLCLQLINFNSKFKNYIAPSDNPGILYNQLKVVDEVYKEAEARGFKVYNYVDTFYDYPYQYLFPWYGVKKYSYLPDEYSNYPLSHKLIYVPGELRYAEPKRTVDGIKFLIIESQTNGEENKDWIMKFRDNHKLISQTKVGGVILEKYQPNTGIPDDYCIWWGNCSK